MHQISTLWLFISVTLAQSNEIPDNGAGFIMTGMSVISLLLYIVIPLGCLCVIITCIIKKRKEYRQIKVLIDQTAQNYQQSHPSHSSTSIAQPTYAKTSV